MTDHGLVIDGVPVPLAVEAGGKRKIEEFLDDPDAWHEKDAAERMDRARKELRAALDGMRVNELESHAASIGAVPKAAKGKQVTKDNIIDAIMAKQTGGD